MVLAGALALSLLPVMASPPAPVPSVEPPVTLAGKPFPAVTPYGSGLAAPRRTRFVAAARENGDGTEARPWNSLPAALCDLSPGDRLLVRKGKYAGDLRIGGSCRNGTPGAPIQVIFEPKTTVEPGPDGAALVIRKAHWQIAGLVMRLENSPHAGISIEGAGAHDVTLESARLSGGAGPSVLISGSSARIAIANTQIAKANLMSAGAESVGIRIEAGARNVSVINCRLHENPGGSVRIDSPAPDGRPASNLEIIGNTIHDDGATAIAIGAALGVRVENNTLSDVPGRGGTRGIALGSVYHAVVRSNHLSGFAVAVQVGRAGAGVSADALVQDASIDHNHLESVSPEGVALDLEAGRGIRFVNNVVEGYADGILLLGIPPVTQKVIVANNLVLRFSRMAFALADPSAVSLFDFNVFSPEGDTAKIETGGKTLDLASFLKEGHMPHSRVVPRVRILDRDLARIAGVETVDRGKAVSGIDFAGRAPDIGVADR